MTEQIINDEKQRINELTLSGTITSPFKRDYSIKGETFYRFTLSTLRKSGNADKVEVVISERFGLLGKKSVGDFISFKGQLRTHCDENGLKIFGYVQEMTEDVEDRDLLFMTGYICKEPRYRTTPRGREIAEIMLAVNREDNKSDYIPCIFWGRNARYVSTLSVGTKISAKGRVQSREYVKKAEDGIQQERKMVNEISIIEFGVIE